MGGNLGSRPDIYQRLHAAARALEARLAGSAARMSRVYDSAPVGPVARQPRFLNAVCSFALARATPASSLLAEILAIEAELGRDRRWPAAQGPRVIDLDLLFAGDHTADEPGLRLPHPRATERAFVLQPLCDLVGGDWVVPGDGRTVARCLRDPALARQLEDLRLYVPPGARGGGCSRDVCPR